MTTSPKHKHVPQRIPQEKEKKIEQHRTKPWYESQHIKTSRTKLGKHNKATELTNLQSTFDPNN